MLHDFTLAEFATVHAEDRTFTIVRGGLGVITTDSFPAEILISVFAEVMPGTVPAGRHLAVFSLVTPSGATIRLQDGDLAIDSPQLSTRFAVPLVLPIHTAGLHRVVLSVPSWASGTYHQVLFVRKMKGPAR